MTTIENVGNRTHQHAGHAVWMINQAEAMQDAG